MPKTAQNSNLHQAKNAKKDEFYTQLTDIENELKHYRHHFKNKVVYCNCDSLRGRRTWQSALPKVIARTKDAAICIISRHTNRLLRSYLPAKGGLPS